MGCLNTVLLNSWLVLRFKSVHPGKLVWPIVEKLFFKNKVQNWVENALKSAPVNMSAGFSPFQLQMLYAVVWDFFNVSTWTKFVNQYIWSNVVLTVSSNLLNIMAFML